MPSPSPLQVFFQVVDTPTDITTQADCFAGADIQVVFRYYASEMSSKVIGLKEAQAISEAGMGVAVVFEGDNTLSYFTEDNGYADGESAYNYANDVIGQPFGSAIYFAVDLDVTDNEIESNIMNYFNGVNSAIGVLSGLDPNYKVGAYGCGAAVNILQNALRCEFKWLSAHTSWNGTINALERGDYELAQNFHEGRKACGIAVNGDNVVNGDVAIIGAFRLGD